MPLPDPQQRRIQDAVARALAEAEDLPSALPRIFEALGLPPGPGLLPIGTEHSSLAEILEATTDFVGISDPEGRSLYRNRALRDLLGVRPPEPSAHLQRAHPDWAARIVLEEGFPTADREGSWRGETAFLDRNGREVPVSQVILAHRDGEGRLRHFSTIARDISAQKDSERALQDLVKRLEDLRHAVDQSAIFSITDARGGILEVNERFCQVSGFGREELLGRTHRIINSGYHPSAFFQEMWNTIRAGGVWRGEIRNRAKNGATFWVDTTIVPWLDADGRPERYMSLHSVITERKLAEEKLLRRERQMELLSAASRELNQDLDLSLVMRRLVATGANLIGAAAGTYGLMEGEHLHIREALKEGRWETLDLTYGRNQGIPGWMMTTLRPCSSEDASEDPRVSPEGRRILGFRAFAAVPILGRRGQMLGFFAIHDKFEGTFDEEDLALLQGLAAHGAVALENARRIEAQRREEEALRHTQKLESLGLLAGGIAHDFNNLLSAILGNLNLAMLEAPPDSILDRRLRNIDRAVVRAADLTRQMLAYTGKGQFQMRRLDLNASVQEIAQLLEASLPKKIRLAFELREGLPPLEADPAQIEQVILNLMTNAADAIGEREGRIRLATGHQDLDEAYLRGIFPGQALAPGPYLTLEVQDTGCGMPPGVLERIFDPFFTTKDKGRGLGLSAMLGILRAHRGGIKIYSEPGQGSTFRILLPAVPAEAPAMERPLDPVPWKGHGTVLVVDDDEDVRATTVAQMEALGFATLEAGDGQEAVDLFRVHEPEITLVFMDLSMPRMDGNEALQAIRSLASGARVILSSGFDRGSASNGGGSAADAFIQKPFRSEDLRRTIRQVLEGPDRA